MQLESHRQQQYDHQQQLAPPPAVQWYPAGAAVQGHHHSAGAYIVVGADGMQMQMQAQPVSSGDASLWASHEPQQPAGLPNIIRKVSNDTTIE